MTWSWAAFLVMSEEMFELDPWECWESREEAFVFLSAFQRANILLHLRTYSCEMLGSWNSLLITPVPLLGEGFFPRPVHVVIWELFSCLGIRWPDRQKMWGWGVASGEMPLGNMTLLWGLRIYSSLGEQLVTKVTQARECSWKMLV